MVDKITSVALGPIAIGLLKGFQIDAKGIYSKNRQKLHEVTDALTRATGESYQLSENKSSYQPMQAEVYIVNNTSSTTEVSSQAEVTLVGDLCSVLQAGKNMPIKLTWNLLKGNFESPQPTPPPHIQCRNHLRLSLRKFSKSKTCGKV